MYLTSKVFKKSFKKLGFIEEDVQKPFYEKFFIEPEDVIYNKDWKIFLENTFEDSIVNVEQQLKTSTAKWNIITSHHSIFSPAEGRDFKYARKKWKPLFDQYNVDLVLNGHDHVYARGHVPKISTNDEAENLRTIYVTSVSGPKQYYLDLSLIHI